MKRKFFDNYQMMKKIRAGIYTRIQHKDVQDYLELLIKNNFLES